MRTRFPSLRRRGEDVIALDIGSSGRTAAPGDRRAAARGHLLGSIRDIDAVAARRQHDRALHRVLELAHIPGPIVAQELIAAPGSCPVSAVTRRPLRQEGRASGDTSSSRSRSGGTLSSMTRKR